MTPPEWSRLTRVALKAHLEAVKQALEAHPDQVAAKSLLDRLLGKGLDHLDPEIIKSDWIQEVGPVPEEDRLRIAFARE